MEHDMNTGKMREVCGMMSQIQEKINKVMSIMEDMGISSEEEYGDKEESSLTDKLSKHKSL